MLSNSDTIKATTNDVIEEQIVDLLDHGIILKRPLKEGTKQGDVDPLPPRRDPHFGGRRTAAAMARAWAPSPNGFGEFAGSVTPHVDQLHAARLSLRRRRAT